MSESDAVAWIDALEAVAIPFWVDGGWGVDALLSEQTRPHNDLDLVIERRLERAVVELLKRRGYDEVTTSFSTPIHSVWRDSERREVDLHLIDIDDGGDGRFGPEVYPAAGLQGHGTIGGRAVRCITPQVMLNSHLGYEPSPYDRADVAALCRRFDLPVPGPYQD